MRAGILACLAVVVLHPACLYDEDARCGPERRLDGLVCVCPRGMVEVDGRCTKPGPTDPAASEDAGSAANSCSSDDECGGEDAICHVPPSAGGYCTRSGCSRHGDCPEGFFCVSDADPPFCSRQPTGQGTSCNSSDDCAGFDASYCGVGDPRGATCWVPGCSEGSCAPGYACFDLGTFVPGTPKVCVLCTDLALLIPEPPEVCAP